MSSLRLSVQRPARFEREITYLPQIKAAVSGEGQTPFHRDRLHEHIYVWLPDEDVWGSVSDEEVRSRSRSLLLDTFHTSAPPENRGFVVLHQVLKELEALASGDGAAGWMDCGQSSARSGPDVPLRMASMPALLCHLRWIYEVFRDTPDLFIDIR